MLARFEPREPAAGISLLQGTRLRIGKMSSGHEIHSPVGSTGFDRTTASKWNALTRRGVLAIRKLSGSRNAPRQLKIFSRRETGIMPQIAVESRLKLVSQDAFSPALEEDSSDLGEPSLSKVYVRIEGGE